MLWLWCIYCTLELCNTILLLWCIYLVLTTMQLIQCLISRWQSSTSLSHRQSTHSHPSQSFTNTSCNAVIMKLPPQTDAHFNQIHLHSITPAPTTPVLFTTASIILNSKFCTSKLQNLSHKLEGIFVWYPPMVHWGKFQWPSEMIHCSGIHYIQGALAYQLQLTFSIY